MCGCLDGVHTGHRKGPGLGEAGQRGAGAAATGVVPLTGAGAAVESDQEKKKSRYRESEHVKAFYRVNRYPK